MEQGEPSRSHYDRAFYSQYSDHRYCTAIKSIDTVRALHQTVVSLRNALDESRQEIEKLKKQIIINNEIQEARPCHHPEAALKAIDYKSLGEKVSELEKIYYKSYPKADSKEVTFTGGASTESVNDEAVKKVESKSDGKKASTFSLAPNISISTQNLNDTATYSTTGGNNNQMASRIDVKIKVSSNINVDNNDTSTDASERSDSPANQSESGKGDDEKSSQKGGPKRENPKVEVEMYEDSNSNTFHVDAKNLKIKVTSEDNVNITKSSDKISVHQTSTEYLNLDIDDLSEGDNSVFTEGATTPIAERLQQVEDEGSDNEAEANEDGELPRDEREDNEDIPDEVDDIELIFSSEDNKDAIQEDLVSLSEYEPWQEGGDAGTPVLTKFSTLTSEDRDKERDAYYENKKALKAARSAKAKEKIQSVETQHSRDKSLESTDSLSFDNHCCEYKSSSMEKDSSIDNTISRDASFDTFVKLPSYVGMGRKWTNVNVLIETDISKVGIGDENVLDMGRRNTCPNPPLYR